MKRLVFAALLIIAIRCGSGSFGAEPRFEKVSDHCYCLQVEAGGNVAAVVTDEGIVIVDPPQEPNLTLTVGALRRITSKAVRWVVFTDPGFTHTAGARFYAARGAQLIASARLRALAMPPGGSEPKDVTASKDEVSAGNTDEPPAYPWFIFDHQMRLYPSNLEIRIFAVEHNALTGGDVVVHVPAEKVLFVGDLYEEARYPEIDTALQGSALGWIDGIKEVIDSVPVLKSAIPQAKPEPKPEEQEKTLEEGIVVVSSHGRISNLQSMKDLLEASQKLRSDVSRAVRSRRSWDSFVASRGADLYRSYGNFAGYSQLLFEALTAAGDHK